ncbi:MAG: DUF6773 family protein [Planctomycetota bacterium]|jgi:hypothetical protein
MKDERIQTTVNRFAAGGYWICFVLILISLGYRIWILKQHPREFWDFFAIFFIANIFVFIAYANKGLFDHGFKRVWLAIFIGGIIGVFSSLFIMGRIHSIVDVGLMLIGFLPGMGLVIAIAYFLNRHWKRKEGIEDEK